MREKMERLYEGKMLEACPSCGDDALDLWHFDKQECDNCDFGKHEDAADIQDERDQLRKSYQSAVQGRREFRQAFREMRNENKALRARVEQLEAEKKRLMAALEFYASEWGWWAEDESADGGSGWAPSEALCKDAGQRARAELDAVKEDDNEAVE